MNMDDRHCKIVEAIEALNEQLRLADNEGLYITIEAEGASITEIDSPPIWPEGREVIFSKSPANVRLLEITQFEEGTKTEKKTPSERAASAFTKVWVAETIKAMLPEFERLGKMMATSGEPVSTKGYPVPNMPSPSNPVETTMSNATIEKITRGGGNG